MMAIISTYQERNRVIKIAFIERCLNRNSHPEVIPKKVLRIWETKTTGEHPTKLQMQLY